MKIKLLALGMILSLANLAEAQISNSHILAHYKLDGNGSDSSGNEQHATEYSILEQQIDLAKLMEHVILMEQTPT